MAYTWQMWKGALLQLRDNFLSAAQQYKAPRACWFCFQYRVKPSAAEAAEDAKRFLKYIARRGAEAEYLLVDFRGRPRLFWSALLEGEPEQNSSFVTLAEQAILLVPSGLIPMERKGVLPQKPSQLLLGGRCGAPEYFYWLMAAADIRRFKPDIRLAVNHFLPAISEAPNSSWSENFHTAAVANIPLDVINRYNDVFDGPLTLRSGYHGPPVWAWCFAQDVWQVSLAAIDWILALIPQDNKGGPKLTPSVRKAYLAWRYAESKAGRQLTDREAFDWLKENGIPDDAGDLGELADYKLPAFETFTSYCTKARGILGEQKYSPTAGRPTGKSVVKQSDI